MTNLQLAHYNDPVPTNLVAVESKQEPSTLAHLYMNNMRLYIVPITADIQASLTGSVEVYASSFEEAASRVQTQIDANTVDGDIEMEDAYSGYSLSYNDVDQFFGITPEIVEDDIEMDDDRECDPAEVLDAEDELLQTTIQWDFETQSRLRAFLETIAETQISAA